MLAGERSSKTAVLLSLGQQSRGAFIDNLDTALSSIETSAGTLPVTLNEGRPRTCYICCPTVAYLDYALSELRHFRGHPALSAALHGLVNISRPVLALSGVDRHVQLNNWLLATNPVPDLREGELREMTGRLTAAHPRHAVIWRSLNDISDKPALAAFRAAGYDLFPARQIYLFDCRGEQPSRHRDERRDHDLLEQEDYAVVLPDQFDPADYARMADLYGQLYLDKYTRLNPQYSAAFMAAAHQGHLISFYGLRREGHLDGVVGFFDLGDVMTAPIVGYDTTLPQSLGLYRRLMAIGMQRARDRRLLFNMSAGAAGFKRNRGAVAAIEYAAVYTRHLSGRQRFASWIVRQVLERIGRSLLTSFEL